MKKRRYRSRMRYPRTTQERRWNCDPDHAPYTRGKRRNLPTSYDDIMVSECRCWKERRRRRYWECDTSGWGMHKFEWAVHGDSSYQAFNSVRTAVTSSDCWHNNGFCCITWYGPAFQEKYL